MDEAEFWQLIDDSCPSRAKGGDEAQHVFLRDQLVIKGGQDCLQYNVFFKDAMQRIQVRVDVCDGLQLLASRAWGRFLSQYEIEEASAWVVALGHDRWRRILEHPDALALCRQTYDPLVGGGAWFADGDAWIATTEHPDPDKSSVAPFDHFHSLVQDGVFAHLSEDIAASPQCANYSNFDEAQLLDFFCNLHALEPLNGPGEG